VIDGQLTVSDARAVREALDSYGRPVEALLVTHPHPDHYAGAATVLDGLDAPIITTAAVAEVIERDDAEKDAIVGPMMGDEWPATRRFPDEVVADGELVRAGGLSLQVIEVGPAESHANVLYALEPRRIFSGDVAYNDMHAYLLDGHHRQWLSTLDGSQASSIRRPSCSWATGSRPACRCCIARPITSAPSSMPCPAHAISASTSATTRWSRP
jgi:glyoxylase-like metal-dependent hydrolase (beta-lactamase superfamily II)